MTQNYQLVYYRSENVGIIGILAYPKSRLPNKHGTLLIEGLRICHILTGNEPRAKTGFYSYMVSAK